MGWFDSERNSSGILATRLAQDASLVQGVGPVYVCVMWVMKTFFSPTTTVPLLGHWDSFGYFGRNVCWNDSGFGHSLRLCVVVDPCAPFSSPFHDSIWVPSAQSLDRSRWEEQESS